MNKTLYDVKLIKNKRGRINMAVINNREAYLASEPEMDITQFHKTALDLKYADESENQILDIFYPEDGEGPYPLVIVFHGGALRRDTREHIISNQCVCL